MRSLVWSANVTAAFSLLGDTILEAPTGGEIQYDLGRELPAGLAIGK